MSSAISIFTEAGEFCNGTLENPDYFFDNQWVSKSGNQVVALGRNKVLEVNLDQDGLLDSVESLDEGYARKDNLTQNLKEKIKQVMP